jgi:hypothetical protein
MTDTTSFLTAEFIEMGLMAAADPDFAERLIEALRRLPAAPAGEPAAAAASREEAPSRLRA